MLAHKMCEDISAKIIFFSKTNQNRGVLLKEVKEDKQQNISNIKDLYKINADGSVPLLFREVKKMKQQVLNLVESFKNQLAQKIKAQEQLRAEEARRAKQASVAQLAPKQQKHRETSSYQQKRIPNSNMKGTYTADCCLWNSIVQPP